MAAQQNAPHAAAVQCSSLQIARFAARRRRLSRLDPRFCSPHEARRMKLAIRRLVVKDVDEGRLDDRRLPRLSAVDVERVPIGDDERRIAALAAVLAALVCVGGGVAFVPLDDRRASNVVEHR